jgi:hypothetical protein
LREIGFDAPIMHELDAVARALESWAPATQEGDTARPRLDAHVERVVDLTDHPSSASY